MKLQEPIFFLRRAFSIVSETAFHLTSNSLISHEGDVISRDGVPVSTPNAEKPPYPTLKTQFSPCDMYAVNIHNPHGNAARVSLKSESTHILRRHQMTKNVPLPRQIM